MSKKMLIDASQNDETRMAIVNDGKLIEYESEFLKLKPTKGNIYLAKIIRVEPSLQAAFVDYGAQRHGFLAYNEIHPDYFKIPTADKEKILAEESAVNSKYSTEETDIEEENFNADKNQDKLVDIGELGKKSFLDKIIGFFNYKPSDDEELFKKEEFKKRKFQKNRNNKVHPLSIHKRYSIQEVIKRNQVILIQVVKEERGNKGAAVTTRLSLAGRYCVLMPNTNKGGGISRKIYDISLRKRLKAILTGLNIKQGMGVIIRTAGQDVKKTDISRDYKALLKLWNQITATTIKSTAPKLIHEEGNLLKRSIRDYFDSNISEVIINNKESHKEAKEIMKFFMPNFLKHVIYENDKSKNSLFALNKIENQINIINNQNVKLKSGGYLVINQTEALVAIDINSGKYTKQRNIEDTALKTNLEAAEEIARQIKLRDLAGLIVIDFIDMLERSNNFKVERKMKESIKNDRARIQCGKISNFGLLEMSRQRLKQIINVANSHKCNVCNGVGRIDSIEFTSMQILRVCEEILIPKDYDRVQILANKNIISFIKNERINFLKNLLRKTEKKIDLIELPFFSISDTAIFNDQEIIYDNCQNEEKIMKALDFTHKTNKTEFKANEKEIKKSNNSISIHNFKNKKQDINTIIEDSTLNKLEEKKIKEPNKRKSFRAKAMNFTKDTNNVSENEKTKKVIKKRSLKNKKQVENISLKQKNNPIKEEEKKQGWWNQ